MNWKEHMVDKKRQEDILKAASRCFIHFGYAKTTMDDIGKMVGLNKASLYYYYKNKEAIFCGIIRSEAEKFLTRLKQEVEAADTWEKGIQVYLKNRERYFQQLGNLNKLSIKTTKQIQFQPGIQELKIQFHHQEEEIVCNILDKAVKSNQIDPVDTKKTASIILAMVNGIKEYALLMEQDDSMILNEVDFTEIDNDIRFGVSLLLNGLKKSS